MRSPTTPAIINGVPTCRRDAITPPLNPKNAVKISVHRSGARIRATNAPRVAEREASEVALPVPTAVAGSVVG
jgi:hypothetical protein